VLVEVIEGFLLVVPFIAVVCLFLGVLVELRTFFTVHLHLCLFRGFLFINNPEFTTIPRIKS